MQEYALLRRIARHMGNIVRRIKKQHGLYYRTGTCGLCGDSQVPLQKISLISGIQWLCLQCLEEKKRTPFVKKGKKEEDKQNSDWNTLTSIGGRN